MTQAQSMYIPPASQCCTTHGIRVLEILCTGSYASKRHVGLNIVRASRHAVFFFIRVISLWIVTYTCMTHVT